MGDDQEQAKIQQAVDMALVNKRIGDLEQWKVIYEKEQQSRIERLEEETNKRISRIEEKIDKFVETITNKFNEQKNTWKNPPYWVTLLFGALVSTIVYLVTSH